jgi:hypothetical protein
MARANLSDLLGKVDEPAPPVEPKPLVERTPRVVAPKPAEAVEPIAKPKPAPRAAAQPLYLRLVRKEARLREEQYANLTLHARRLSRARGGQGARITENTLIRVAVDLLLERIDKAAGGDEEALLRSLR